jgi:hypothetical protein
MCIFQPNKRRKYRREFTQLKQELRNRQLLATKLFIQIKDNPNTDSDCKQKLDVLNKEADALSVRIIELEHLI